MSSLVLTQWPSLEQHYGERRAFQSQANNYQQKENHTHRCLMIILLFQHTRVCTLHKPTHRGVIHAPYSAEFWAAPPPPPNRFIKASRKNGWNASSLPPPPHPPPQLLFFISLYLLEQGCRWGAGVCTCVCVCVWERDSCDETITEAHRAFPHLTSSSPAPPSARLSLSAPACCLPTIPLYSLLTVSLACQMLFGVDPKTADCIGLSVDIKTIKKKKSSTH